MGPALEVGGGKWTLINVWATHCQVCLEEMPLLRGWERKLPDRLRVAFVNVDEEAAPAVKFLSSQPKAGVRRSYHLGDFATRSRWVTKMGASVSTLPIQILVDTKGIVQCLALRPVQEADFAEVEALVSAAARDENGRN